MAEQANFISTYAKRHGYRITETYSDPAVSGLSLKGRPAMRQLLADALAPGRSFEAILVYDVSRWGRYQDIDEGAHYEFICRQAGLQVRYCAEAFENDGSPESELMKQFKRATAAEFSREVSTRTRSSQRFLASQGYRATGMAPFGYERIVAGGHRGETARLGRLGQAPLGWRTRLDPGPPDAVATVREIFRLFVEERCSYAQIAKTLNAAGSPIRGTAWTSHSVRSVLHREEYTGVSFYGRSRRILGGPSTRAPDEAVIRVEDAWPAIISREVFIAARLRMIERKLAPTRDQLLADLVRLLARHGRLDSRIIADAPDTFSLSSYYRCFGQLSRAYAAIGYKPQKRQGLRGARPCLS